VASNKRKLESAPEGLSANAPDHQAEENPAKRIKVQHSPSDTALPEHTEDELKKDSPNSETVKTADESTSDAFRPGDLPPEETAQKGSQLADKNSLQAAGVKGGANDEVEKLPEQRDVVAPPQESNDQKAREEQLDPTGHDEDMNFESMFDLNFDLDLNPDNLVSSNTFDSAQHDGSNLELLPGLESYANASGDDFSMLNLPASTIGEKSGVQALNNNFDLPEIQGDSNFNDLFADGDFGGDASLMDLDLEDDFFNT
jgi:hypothetical protein